MYLRLICIFLKINMLLEILYWNWMKGGTVMCVM